MRRDVVEVTLHEIFHHRISGNKELQDRLVEYIQQNYDMEEVSELFDKYRNIYREIVKGMAPDKQAEYIWQEMLADAYAELERFPETEGIVQWSEYVREAMEQAETKNTAEGGVRYAAGQSSAANTQLQYDYTKPFADQIADFQTGNFPQRDTLTLGATPTVLKRVGLVGLPMTINQQHVGDALNGTYNGTLQEKLDHTFTPQELATLPEKIADPIAIIHDKRTGKANPSISNIDVLVEMKVASGKDVIVAVQVGGNGQINGLRIDANKVSTVHGNTDTITRLVDAINDELNGNVAVFYLNKGKTTKALQRAGNPIPRRLSNLDGFIHSITDPGSPVKIRISSVTESKQFMDWFGNWKKHPESASKVVNADGTPKVMYHGTSRGGFTVFNTYGSNFGLFGLGSYFTDDPEVALSYTKKGKGDNPAVYEVYLNIKNPIDMDAAADLGQWRKAFKDFDLDTSYLANVLTNEDAFRALKENLADAYYEKHEAEDAVLSMLEHMGYDGITHIGGGRFDKNDTNRHRVYIAFNPEQIKSATDNIGTFDKERSDIRFSMTTEQDLEDFADWTEEDLRQHIETMDSAENVEYNEMERAAAEAARNFQINFTGEIRKGKSVSLSRTEVEAIRHALKTGYGKISLNGRSGAVNTSAFCYLFKVDNGKVIITKVVKHEDLNIRKNVAREMYRSEDLRKDNEETVSKIKNSGNRRGDLGDNFASTNGTGGYGENASLDGEKSRSEIERDLRQSAGTARGPRDVERVTLRIRQIEHELKYNIALTQRQRNDLARERKKLIEQRKELKKSMPRFSMATEQAETNNTAKIGGEARMSAAEDEELQWAGNEDLYSIENRVGQEYNDDIKLDEDADLGPRGDPRNMPDSAREWHAFNRSFANKTMGMKPGEHRVITIFTASNIYHISADGYMRGYAEMKTPLDKKQRGKRKDGKERANGADTNRRTADRWVDAVRYRRRGSGRNIFELADGRSTMADDKLYGESSGRNQSRSFETDVENYQELEENEERIPGSLVYDGNGRVYEVD